MKYWTPLILALLLVTGCSAALGPQRATDSVSEIEELKRRVLELQKQSTVHELELDRLRQRLAALEGPSANRRSSTDRSPSRERLEATRRTPPPVRDVVEDSVPEPRRPVQIRESDLDEDAFGQPVEPPLGSGSQGQNEAGRDGANRGEDRVAAGTPGAAVRTVPPPGQTPEQPPAPRAAVDPVPAEAQALYDQGYTRYHEGRFIDAESTFQRFLQSHSNTDLADNAQYWIGESRYARKDFQGALAAFRETVQRFPDGNKVPDAMIKAGQCFEQLGDRAAARDTYREVRERFPNSVAAVAAAEYLDELR